MQITNISDAKASLSNLIKTIQETQESIIIGKAGKPVAILSPFNEDSSPRVLGGSWQGQVKIADDFDQENEEVINSFYNSTIFPAKK